MRSALLIFKLKSDESGYGQKRLLGGAGLVLSQNQPGSAQEAMSVSCPCCHRSIPTYLLIALSPNLVDLGCDELWLQWELISQQRLWQINYCGEKSSP